MQSWPDSSTDPCHLGICVQTYYLGIWALVHLFPNSPFILSHILRTSHPQKAKTYSFQVDMEHLLCPDFTIEPQNHFWDPKPCILIHVLWFFFYCLLCSNCPFCPLSLMNPLSCKATESLSHLWSFSLLTPKGELTTHFLVSQCTP